MNQHSRWNNLRTCKEFFHITRFSCNSYIWPKKNVWSCRKSDIWHKGKLFPCKYKTCAAMGMVYFVVGSNHSKGLQLKTKRNNSKLLHWIGMNCKKVLSFYIVVAYYLETGIAGFSLFDRLHCIKVYFTVKAYLLILREFVALH